MAAMPTDLTPEQPAPVERVEFVKCETAWCRTNLGVRMRGGRVYWHVPTVVDLHDRSVEIPCPCCKAVRVWKIRSIR